MAIDRLVNLPAGTDVFLDANIFIYTFSGRSNECRDLLRRCATEEVFGITTLEVIDEVTHRLMLVEAVAKGIITRQSAAALKGKWTDVAKLSEYWTFTSRIFGLNILIVTSDESRLHRAQTVRSSHGLLTTDSLILAAMIEYGIDCLASRDGDFDHVASLTIYKPTDI
jgi:predicted nucleic acid-binding protein